VINNKLRKDDKMKLSISGASMVMIMITAVLMLLSSGSAASAQETTPCAKDFAKYCSNVTPGGGRLVRCYEENKNSMSPACRSWAEGVKANAESLKQACSKEIDASCNSEKGDPLAMIGCLQGNYISLSPDCVTALNQFKWRYPQPAR
jgi:hypothetical protein